MLLIMMLWKSCNKHFFRDTVSKIRAHHIRCRLRTHIEAASCMTTYPNKILMAVAPKASQTFGSTPVLRYNTVHPAIRRAHISTTVISVSDRLWIVPCFYTWLLQRCKAANTSTHAPSVFIFCATREALTWGWIKVYSLSMHFHCLRHRQTYTTPNGG